MGLIFSITRGNLLKPPSRGRLPPQNIEMIRWDFELVCSVIQEGFSSCALSGNDRFLVGVRFTKVNFEQKGEVK
jgi:hypothetical protein